MTTIVNEVYGGVYDLMEIESAVGDLYRVVYPESPEAPVSGRLALAYIADAIDDIDADAVLTDVFEWFHPMQEVPKDPMTLRAKILQTIGKRASA